MKRTFIAALTVAFLPAVNAATRVDIADDQALERIRIDNPAQYEKVAAIIRMASSVNCETLPRMLKVQYGASDVRCAGATILTSYPAKRRLSFKLDDTHFSGNVVLTGKPGTLVPAWVAPANPDPRQILIEAREDAQAGRYSDALDKQLWIHNESLKFAPSYSGVRLSYGIAMWKELANRYPPALDALKSARDKAMADARTAPAPYQPFSDASAINEVLGEPGRTAELFAWLDANKPEEARRLFHVAQNSLVMAHQYALCGKYIDGASETDRIIGMHRTNKSFTERNRPGFVTYMNRSFTNRATTLVALLAVNGRRDEAQAAEREFLKEMPDESFRTQLDQALGGSVPEPWPRLGG